MSSNLKSFFTALPKNASLGGLVVAITFISFLLGMIYNISYFAAFDIRLISLMYAEDMFAFTVTNFSFGLLVMMMFAILLAIVLSIHMVLFYAIIPGLFGKKFDPKNIGKKTETWGKLSVVIFYIILFILPFFPLIDIIVNFQIPFVAYSLIFAAIFFFLAAWVILSLFTTTKEKFFVIPLVLFSFVINVGYFQGFLDIHGNGKRYFLQTIDNPNIKEVGFLRNLGPGILIIKDCHVDLIPHSRITKFSVAYVGKRPEVRANQKFKGCELHILDPVREQ